MRSIFVTSGLSVGQWVICIAVGSLVLWVFEIVKNILYIPGNHDHHIWETARETQYVNYIDRIPAGTHLEIPWHTTKMFSPDLVRGYFLTDLIQRYPHLQDAVVNIIYPNYALVSSDGHKCIIFNHGHYVDLFAHEYAEYNDIP